MSKEIIVYSAAFCGDCQSLKAYMARKGITYESRDIRENPAHAEELAEKTGKEGVPYVVIDGEWKRGYEPGEPFTDAFADNLFGQ